VPGIIAASSSEPSLRRILCEKISSLEADGFELIKSQDGGTWQDLFSMTMTSGLFASRGYVRVESAELLGVFPDKLITMVEAVDTASTLFILVYSNDHKKYFPKELSDRIKVIIPPKVPKWRDKRYEWLKAEALDNGISINRDAAILLIDILEEPEEVLSELSKLSDAGNGPITIQMVKELTLDEGKNALLQLMDGICTASPENVIHGFEVLKRKSDVIPVISALYNRIRIAALLHGFRTYDSGKVRQKLHFRNYQFKMSMELFKHYEVEKILWFTAELIKLDYMEKTNSFIGWTGIESCILEFMAGADEKRKKRRTP